MADDKERPKIYGQGKTSIIPQPLFKLPATHIVPELYESLLRAEFARTLITSDFALDMLVYDLKNIIEKIIENAKATEELKNER